MKQSLRSVLLVAALAAPSFAGTGVIGVASALGSFSLNNTPVTGTANVADGANIATTSATSQVFLQNGSTVSLGTNSAAKVYSNKVVLESGVTRIDKMGSSFDLQANGYRIEGEKSTELVARLSGNQLQIASIAGAFSVYDSKGVLLKTVSSGTGVAFEGQSGASAGQGTGQPAGTSGGGAVSGGGTSTPLSNSTALLIVGGLIAAGAGIGAYYGTKGSGNTNPISPI
jgi:hypothetical protein